MEKYLFDPARPIHYLIGAALLVAVVMLAMHGFHPGMLLLAPAAALSEDIEALATEFKKRNSEFGTTAAELKDMHKELDGRMAKNEDASKELKEAIDKALTRFNGLKEGLTEIEQKLAAANDDEQRTIKSWGEQFVESDSFKGIENFGSKRATASTEVKQVTSAEAGGLIRSMRETEVVSLQRERRVMRDLLRTVPINTSSVDYAVQTTRTNNAAPVAEAAAKPYSDYAWSSQTAVVRTLAHLAKITRQAMDDAPRLVGEIDSEMRYGLGYVEERQFLYGSGVGQNLHGIIPQATAFARPAGVVAADITFASRVDVLRVAMLQAALGLLPADGIVLNQLDWALIELTKTQDGAYLFANPQGNVDARMWGLPVVATPAIDAGDFLVGSFRMGATVYDRMGVEVLISTENDKDFENNLASIRAEERVAIAVKRPGAFVYGDFASALTALAAP